MLLFPNEYYECIEDIQLDVLISKGIKGIILDVDNTIINKSRVLELKVVNWVNEAKNKKIKICILSNSSIKTKVKNVAEVLNVPYYMFAKKPFSGGFKKCMKSLELKSNEITVIGDQIFTDVLGGNIMKMHTIYTKPRGIDCNIITRLNRNFEKIVLKKYLVKEGKKNNENM